MYKTLDPTYNYCLISLPSFKTKCLKSFIPTISLLSFLLYSLKSDFAPTAPVNHLFSSSSPTSALVNPMINSQSS